MKIFLENNFMCLVTLWKSIFHHHPHKTHHHTTGKPPKHHHPRHHNNNNKIRDQREKVKNQNHKQILLQKFQMRTRMNRCEWVRRGSSVRVGSSGFVGVSGFVKLRRCKWVRRASLVQVGSRCDDLSTLFVSLFARGLEMARRSWWSVTRFDEGGFERSKRCDCLASTSAIFLLFFSLSLLFSKAENHLKWKWKRKRFSVILALIFGQLEMLFSLTEFEVTTKH